MVYRLGLGVFDHACRVATFAAGLSVGLLGWGVLSERQIRFAEAQTGRRLASVAVGSLPGGRSAVHRPDLALVSLSRRVMAVEVELSVKALRRLLVCVAAGREPRMWIASTTWPTTRRRALSHGRLPAAALLSVKTSWIYEAVRTGRLPCLRIGRHIRFTRTMLEDWLTSQ
ncbi:MAG TPA: helix-turn-helix domain-containing protein [Solirubrobacteraceae bacterium]